MDVAIVATYPASCDETWSDAHEPRVGVVVRAVPLKIMRIWVNKVDSEHEHGKWLAPDRLGEFCDMVEHISDIYGEYGEIAGQRAAELRERFGL